MLWARQCAPSSQWQEGEFLNPETCVIEFCDLICFKQRVQIGTVIVREHNECRL